MRRFVLIALVLVLALILISAGTAWYLANDEAFLKSQLSKVVLEQTGRELAVDGPLTLDIGRQTSIEASGIRFQNAAWAEQADMVRVGRLAVTIDIPSLWDETIIIPELSIEDCSIDLLKNENGEANWDVLPEAEPDPEPPPPRTALPVQGNHVRIRNCSLDLDAPERERPLQIRLADLELRLSDENRWVGDGAGSINDEEFSLSGWYGPVGAFYLGKPVEHQLQLSLGDISLESSGTIEDALSFSGANVQARFHGPDIGKVLHNFSAPPVSEGAFDFRLELDSEGEVTTLELIGDLGSLNARASGEFDRLKDTRTGHITATVDGPDLEAMGQAFGVQGLVSDAFSLKADANFSEGLTTVKYATLETSMDRVSINGDLGTGADLANTALDIDLTSDEIGRWMPALNQEPKNIGPIKLEGSLASDPEGLFSTDSEITLGDSTIKLAGAIGPLAGPHHPDLDFEFNSKNPRSLFLLAGIAGFPEVPLSVNGFIAFKDMMLQMNAVKLELAGDSVSVDGQFNFDEGHAGSEMDVAVDIADVAKLGSLFGEEGLPSEPLKLSSTLKPVGKGLAFQVADGDMGQIQIELEGKIEDLANPLAMNARYDISLPTLRLLDFIVPDHPVPDLPLSSSGSLVNEKGLTRLDGLKLSLGQLKAGVDGQIGHDKSFDILVDVSGSDASLLSDYVGMELIQDPFSVKTALSGNPRELTFSGLQASLGRSRMQGDLKIKLDDDTKISGKLHSPLLDLSWWKTEESEPEAAPAAAPSEWVFDDTPVLRVADYGIEADLDLSIEELDLGNTQIYDFALGLMLIPDFVRLDPISMRGRLGSGISGIVSLDARGGVPEMDLNLDGKDIRLGLMAAEEQDAATYPPISLNLALQGSGMTNRELASGLNGLLRIKMDSGLVASSGVGFLMSDFLTELFSTLNPFAETSEYTNLNCAVAAANIVDGQVEVYPVIVQTEQLTILTEGSIDLNTEDIDLSFNTKVRQGLGLSAGMIINPLIKVGGRMASPAVELDPAGAVVSGGLAVATAGISLLAKSMSDRFLSSKDPCGDALKEIEKRDSETSQ